MATLLSGAFWERHCAKHLRSAGFEPVANWESTFIHKDFQMILSACVGDFKMAGPGDNMKKAWPRKIRGGVQRHYQNFDGTRSVVVVSISHFE